MRDGRPVGIADRAICRGDRSGAQRIDAGRKLETAVFLHWRRQREDLAYLGGEREIDLLINIEQPQALINVTLSDVQSQTWEREIGALEWAKEMAPQAERILVVHERSQREPPAGIRVVDAWRYLLDESAGARTETTS